MENFGLELRQARERLGVSLREIAARTKISVTALEALERNEFSQLPGGIFGRAFVRAYATEVGVDPDASVASFIELLERSEQEAAARDAVRPEITDDDRQFLARQHRAVNALRALAVLAALAIVVLGVWQVRLFLQRRAIAQGGAPVTASTPVEALATGGSAGTTDATAPVQAPAPATAPSGSTQRVLVEFDVMADCWMSIGVDGQSPVAQLFKAGDHQRIEADREVLLDVGNAGALRLQIGGKPARPLGREGIPVRTRITRDNQAQFQQ